MANHRSWRLEPATHGAPLKSTIQARLYDPLWMLCRQWQVGELRGEDAGSPAHVRLRLERQPITSWCPAGSGDWRSLNPKQPLEAQVCAEPAADFDLSARLELGRVFDVALADVAPGPDPLAAQRVAPFTLEAPGEVERASLSPVVRALYRRLAGRAWDGVALLTGRAAFVASCPTSLRGAANAALDVLADTCRRAFGDPGPASPPPTWDSRTLGMSVDLSTAGGHIHLRAEPDDEGDFDWYAAEVVKDDKVGWTSVTTVPEKIELLPASFRGAPNHRWWDFEDADSHLVGLKMAAEGDTPHIWALEYLLEAGNDWFLVPVDLRLGDVVRVARKGTEPFVVTDVFGVRTVVPGHHGLESRPYGQNRFGMFLPSARNAANGQQPELSDMLVLLPSWASFHGRGPALEEVEFVRDEMANIAWAIERTLPDSLGRPRSTRDIQADASSPGPSGGGTGWRYRLQTEVPRNWVPLVPEWQDTHWTGQIQLRRAALWAAGRTFVADLRGRILHAAGPGLPYRIREEALPRAGVCVSRDPIRGRDLDGGVITWRQWRRRVGRGEAGSGLRYDVLEPDQKPPGVE